jgi:methylated-DNA-[protein]-cysteine S-methyltransferase
MSEFRQTNYSGATSLKNMIQQLQFQMESVPTPTGVMRLISDADGAIRALDWDDHEPRLLRLLRLHYGEGGARLQPRSDVSAARRALEAYFDGEMVALDALPVQVGGTPFQRQVWTALRDIPVGATECYAGLASRIGREKAARAVGMANNGNPVAIIVPCHRIIGRNGALTGYGGGLERKLWLLRHEGALI